MSVRGEEVGGEGRECRFLFFSPLLFLFFFPFSPLNFLLRFFLRFPSLLRLFVLLRGHANVLFGVVQDVGMEFDLG